jgi:hypothetical protein
VRRIFLVGALLIGSAQLLGQLRPPPDTLYRGPYLLSRDAEFIVPTRGAPLAFTNSTLQQTWVLTTSVRSRTVYSVDPARITLRTAFGPTERGFITFRMVHDQRELNPSVRIVPDRPPVLVQFVIAPEETAPGPLALKPQMRVVFTVERIERDNGALLFDNPDATELLWEALGRPSRTPR